MQVHLLAGCRELLQPEIICPESVAGLIGPGIRVAKAHWLGPDCGDEYHDFLQEKPGDRRTEVMAQALQDGFGSQFAPLLVLPDLLSEVSVPDLREAPTAVPNRRSQYRVLTEILTFGHVAHLHIHGVAVPSKADPDGTWAVPAGIVPGIVREQVERLREAIVSDNETCDVETRVHEVTPDVSIFNALYNNAVCNQFASRLAQKLAEQGWGSDLEALSAAIFRVLSDWNEKGIYVGLPLAQDQFEEMADILLEKLVRR